MEGVWWWWWCFALHHAHTVDNAHMCALVPKNITYMCLLSLFHTCVYCHHHSLETGAVESVRLTTLPREWSAFDARSPNLRVLTKEE